MEYSPELGQGSNVALDSSEGILEPKIGGYNERFDPPVQPDYECPVCKLCLRDPVQTNCGHRFCKSCMQRHMRTNANALCPVCKRPLLSAIFDDNFVKREINLFIVKCSTVKNGKECAWKGELQSIELHLETCEYVIVQCPNFGCDQTGERRKLCDHLKNECPMRMTKCSLCNKTDVRFCNSEFHLGKCPKLNVNCPHCSQEFLREELATHEKECPNAVTCCEFMTCGCEWSGVRSQHPVHCQDQVEKHLSLARVRISVLEITNANWETRFAIANAGFSSAIADISRAIADLEARSCNGESLWHINNYSKHLAAACLGSPYCVDSQPFYTSFNGYKFHLRIFPNGVDNGYGSHVALSVHLIRSEWDDTLDWPFSGNIVLTILDRSDDTSPKCHIREEITNGLTLLQRPTSSCNDEGCGSVKFTPLETLQQQKYVKNDCLVVAFKLGI